MNSGSLEMGMLIIGTRNEYTTMTKYKQSKRVDFLWGFGGLAHQSTEGMVQREFPFKLHVLLFYRVISAPVTHIYQVLKKNIMYNRMEDIKFQLKLQHNRNMTRVLYWRDDTTKLLQPSTYKIYTHIQNSNFKCPK